MVARAYQFPSALRGVSLAERDKSGRTGGNLLDFLEREKVGLGSVYLKGEQLTLSWKISSTAVSSERVDALGERTLDTLLFLAHAAGRHFGEWCCWW